ncbi:MAG: sugar ABC transporter ATP-binding protein [Terrisporobacter sp.]
MEKIELEIKNLNKYYGKVQVLHDINLKIEKGEIHGIIGPNGCGKSTFMNILFGNSVIKDTGGYKGEILIEGEHIKMNNSSQAIKCGIGMIHQEFTLLPYMSVSENIKLTRENTVKMSEKILSKDLTYVDKKKNCEETKAILNKLGFEIDCDLLVKNLSVNAMQFVEIGREIDNENLKILFLDEPTAVLNKEDSMKLMKVIKDLANKGVTIIFVSHRLHEIKEICDKVTVLRDGKIVIQYEKDEITIKKLAHAMMGYDVKKIEKKIVKSNNKTILTMKNFYVKMQGEEIKNLNLEIKEGEILGVTSLSGHGKLALGYGIMGMFPCEGEVILEETVLDLENVRDNINKGIFLIPDDRKKMGLLMEHSIKDNIVFSGLYGKNKFLKKINMFFKIKDDKSINENVKNYIDKLEIKCINEKQNVSELSGGNQQKICIARALCMDPKILFLLEPTRGVDIGAKEKILDMILEMNERNNMTVVVISSELEELKRISDRVAVLCEGKLSNILPPNSRDEEFALAYTGEGAYYASQKASNNY